MLFEILRMGAASIEQMSLGICPAWGAKVSRWLAPPLKSVLP